MTNREKDVLAKMAKYGIHPDPERLRAFIKMVDETFRAMNQKKAIEMLTVVKKPEFPHIKVELDKL